MMESQPSLDLINELQRLLVPSTSASESKHNRRQACDFARKLWLELEEPGDLIDRIIYQTQENAILRLALDLGIYDFIVQRGDTVNSEDVATETGADRTLIGRILRNLAALGHINETSMDTFAANKISRAFTTPKGVNGANFSFEFATPAWNQIPAFLKSSDYRNPTDPLDAPLQRAFNSKKHFFDLMLERNVLEMFQTFMSSYRVDRAEFLDVFPAEERLIQGCESSLAADGVLLVDVGGGRGHEIQKFVGKFPQKKGRMILQDQPDIVKEVPQSDVMDIMIHDFFTPQPVKGARCYYFRMILHDWPDDQCVEILRNVASAMTPGYSKVIINDIVLPSVGANRFATQSDMNMMALLASTERTETQWRLLVELAGLEVIKIWPGTPESVVEAMLRTGGDL